MTRLEQFEQNPWGSLHGTYKRSFLYITPAPESVTGEILLASLHRNVGFSKTANEEVWKLGTPFRKQLEAGKRPNKKNSPIGIDSNLWKNIINRAIAAPKLAGQSKQRVQQTSPIVPDSSLYSMSARLTGHPWNPGKLVARMIALGTGDQERAFSIWEKLFEKLSIDDLEDDIWARLLQTEFESWRIDELKDAWHCPLEFPIRDEEFSMASNINYPAKHFVRDLEEVLTLKKNLTRRQWITTLESLCRIGTSAHIMWLCKANEWCSKAVESALSEGKSYTCNEVESHLSTGSGFWSLGQLSGKTIKDTVRRYITSRCSLNLFFHMLEEDKVFDMEQVCFDSPDKITATLTYLSQNREKFNFNDYLSKLAAAMEVDSRIADCKKGTSKNVLEFLEHVTRQRITSEVGLESYDQGYYLRKKGAYSSAPWVVGLGPLSVLLMVHCADSKEIGPCTVQKLAQQLSNYGIDANLQLSKGGSLNKLLREMSIAVDSPDAEGGMVISSPLATLSGDEE